MTKTATKTKTPATDAIVTDPLGGYYEKDPASDIVPIELIEAGIYEVGDVPDASLEAEYKDHPEDELPIIWPPEMLKDIAWLVPSPTNPRKRFPDASINELAASIESVGIIEPLVVRQGSSVSDRPNGKNNGFEIDTILEIVCGERRYKAAVKAGLNQLPCIVRELTDEQVLDIQIHENLHREDVAPMDEAFGYKFLQDKLGCGLKELSLRVGKSEAFILNRLKLNALIDEIQMDIDAGIVPLAYALEIAKFSDPATQKDVYDECFDTDWDNVLGKHVPNKTELKPFKDLIWHINNEVLLQISKAPFNAKATNLRDDGLACGKCPERTGAAPGLFDKYEIGKKDCCLNRACYQAKTSRHLDLIRDTIAHDQGVDRENVPLVDGRRYSDRGDGVLTFYDFQKVADAEAGKEGVIRAVSASSDDFGQPVYIKLKADSSDGPSTSSVREKGSEKSAAEKKAFYKRKEELFDIKVGEIVRKRVLHLAGDKFAASFTIDGAGTDFLPQLLAKIWTTSNNGDDNCTKNQVVKPIMAEAMDASESDCQFGHYDAHGAYSRLSTYSCHNPNLMLFLFVHGNKGGMYYDSYKSQKPIRDLAEEYGIDYQLIDAEIRVECASKKARKMHEDYLKAIQDNKRDTPVPRQFLNTYKAID